MARQPKIAVTYRLPPELVAKIDQEASNRNLCKSKLIVEILEKALKKVKVNI